MNRLDQLRAIGDGDFSTHVPVTTRDVRLLVAAADAAIRMITTNPTDDRTKSWLRPKREAELGDACRELLDEPETTR